jgi:hypothetical protein
MATKAAVGKAVGAGRIKASVAGLAVVLALGVASAAGVGTELDGRAAGGTEQVAPVSSASSQQSGFGGPVGSAADSRPPSFGSERASGERQSGGDGSSGSDADSRPPSLY